MEDDRTELFSRIDEVFVGRKSELNQLHSYLEEAVKGTPRICFVSGEAGTGKTTLLEKFAQQVQEKYENLLVVVGRCNKDVGAGDPYLPFRIILGTLMADPDLWTASTALARDNARRLQNALKAVLRVLVEIAPDLVGTLVPGAQILASAAKHLAEEGGLLDKLEKQAKRGSRQEEIEPAEIFLQYTGLLRKLSESYPLVVVLEDLHWIDPASVGLLFYLVRELREGRVLIIGTYRANEITNEASDQRHPLESTLNEIKRICGDVWIELDETDTHSPQEFVKLFLDAIPNDLSPGFYADFAEHTGGNPLFAKELLKSFLEGGETAVDSTGRLVESHTLRWEALPARVEAVIEERYRRLPTNLQEILSVASVEGNEFTAQVVAEVTQRDEREVLKILSQELERRHRIVKEVGAIRAGHAVLARFSFVHALFQLHVYHSLGHGERRALHEQVAFCLENLYGSDTAHEAAQLGYHFAEGGIMDKAGGYLKQAGEKAFELAAFVEARSYFQRALESLDVFADEKMEEMEAELLWWMGRTYYGTGEYRDAQRYFEQALTRAQRLESSKLIVTTQLWLGSSLWRQRLYDKALPILREALTLSREMGDPDAEQRALNNLGIVYGRLANYDTALQFYQKSYEVACRTGNLTRQAVYFNNMGTMLSDQGLFDQALVAFEKALAIGEETGILASCGLYLGNLGSCKYNLGEHNQALSYLRAGLQRASETGNVARRALHDMRLGRVALGMNNLSGAIDYFNRSITHADHVSLYSAMTWSRLGLALCHLMHDDVEQALEVVRTANTYIIPHNTYWSETTAASGPAIEGIALARLKRFSEAAQVFKKDLTFLQQKVASKRWHGRYFYALTLAGYTLTADQAVSEQQIQSCIEAYETAVNYCGYHQVIYEAYLVFGELFKADRQGILLPVQHYLQQRLEKTP